MDGLHKVISRKWRSGLRVMSVEKPILLQKQECAWIRAECIVNGSVSWRTFDDYCIDPSGILFIVQQYTVYVKYCKPVLKCPLYSSRNFAKTLAWLQWTLRNSSDCNETLQFGYLYILRSGGNMFKLTCGSILNGWRSCGWQSVRSLEKGHVFKYL